MLPQWNDGTRKAIGFAERLARSVRLDWQRSRLDRTTSLGKYTSVCTGASRKTGGEIKTELEASTPRAPSSSGVSALGDSLGTQPRHALIERPLDRPAEGQGPVERGGELDRGPVADCPIHAHDEVDDLGQRLGLRPGVAGVQHNQPEIPLVAGAQHAHEGGLADHLRPDPGSDAVVVGRIRPDQFHVPFIRRS